jgi:hypothetical protein
MCLKGFGRLVIISKKKSALQKKAWLCLLPTGWAKLEPSTHKFFDMKFFEQQEICDVDNRMNSKFGKSKRLSYSMNKKNATHFVLDLFLLLLDIMVLQR